MRKLSTRSAEEYRQLIQVEVKEALRKGHRPTVIGQTVASDFGFVRKLFDPNHKFKQSTMLLVYSKLPLLDADPAIPYRSQRYLLP